MDFRTKIGWSLCVALLIGLSAVPFLEEISKLGAGAPDPFGLLVHVLLVFPAILAGSGNLHHPVANYGAFAAIVAFFVFGVTFLVLSLNSGVGRNGRRYDGLVRLRLMAWCIPYGIFGGALFMVLLSGIGLLFIKQSERHTISVGSSIGAALFVGLLYGFVTGCIVGGIECFCAPDKLLEGALKKGKQRTQIDPPLSPRS